MSKLFRSIESSIEINIIIYNDNFYWLNLGLLKNYLISTKILNFVKYAFSYEIFS